MKNKLSFAAILVSAALVGACSKTTDTPAPAASPEKAQAAAATAAQNAPREATYDPNLQPAQIVWDSPEKKAQWEARQAQLQGIAPAQAQQAPAQQGAPSAPAAPAR